MLKCFGHCLLILALLGATGGHWAVLQGIAWTDMLATNLQSDSVGEAITKTFDGAHPCKLCKQISSGKQSEKQSDLSLQIKKLEFVSQSPTIIFVAPQDLHPVPELVFLVDGLLHRPPVPPPRNFVG